VISKRAILGILLFVVGVTGYSVNKFSSQSQHSPDHAAVSKQSSQPAVPVAEVGKTPHVTIINDKGKEIGTAVLKQEANGVSMHVKVSALPPGKHGIHIHEAAFEDSDFDSSGAHLNPYNKHHGLNNPKGPHLGDMPNLDVKSDGMAEGDFMITGASLEPGKENSLRGRSIIIHAKEDDQKTDPSGNSGNRIAGGVIPE
jgi:superoxide dismutase, Cu-Zn family